MAEKRCNRTVLNNVCIVMLSNHLLIQDRAVINLRRMYDGEPLRRDGNLYSSCILVYTYHT